MNKFDDVRLDLPSLLAEQRRRNLTDRLPCGSGEDVSIGGFVQMWLKRRMVERLVDWRVWERLVHSNIALGWFHEFERYWVEELHLRPISPPDFHFLKGVYRQRFQTLIDVSDVNAALNPLAARDVIRWIPRHGTVLEFGCGLAPITNSLTRFYRDRNLRITCADVEHVLFHNMRSRFSAEPCVRRVFVV